MRTFMLAQEWQSTHSALGLHHYQTAQGLATFLKSEARR